MQWQSKLAHILHPLWKKIILNMMQFWRETVLRTSTSTWGDAHSVEVISTHPEIKKQKQVVITGKQAVWTQKSLGNYLSWPHGLATQQVTDRSNNSEKSTWLLLSTTSPPHEQKGGTCEASDSLSKWWNKQTCHTNNAWLLVQPEREHNRVWTTSECDATTATAAWRFSGRYWAYHVHRHSQIVLQGVFLHPAETYKCTTQGGCIYLFACVDVCMCLFGGQRAVWSSRWLKTLGAVNTSSLCVHSCACVRRPCWTTCAPPGGEPGPLLAWVDWQAGWRASSAVRAHSHPHHQ